MGDPISLALFAASSGAALLGAHLMAHRWAIAFAYRIGAVLFVLVALIQALNALDAATARLPAWTIQMSGGLVATAFPAAWLYVRDLTSDTPRPLTRRDFWHFALPAAFALHILWAGVFLSRASEDSLWGVGDMDAGATWFAGAGLALTGAWVVQISFYSWRIAYELIRLPRRLRRAFSDMGGRDLFWFRVLGGLVLAHLPFLLLANIGELDVPDQAFSLFASALTFGLAGLAVSQTPVFQLSPGASQRVAPGPEDSAGSSMDQPVAEDANRASAETDARSEKYARSLLDADRLARIAARVEAAFNDGALHLDPGLSLTRLSERVAVSENHLSQTFTRQIGVSFFDYVNAKRVEAAKVMLRQGGESVIDIAVAVGFNSRSAFYNAFKTAVGTTPAAYRRLHASDAA